MDDAGRQIRRLEERSRAADLEKAAVEKARKFLEEEMNKMHELVAYFLSFFFRFKLI